MSVDRIEELELKIRLQVTSIEKPTKAKFFKNLNVGDVFTIASIMKYVPTPDYMKDYDVEPYYASISHYRLVNLETGETEALPSGVIAQRLINFGLVEI